MEPVNETCSRPAVDQPLDQGLNDLLAQRLVAGAAGGESIIVYLIVTWFRVLFRRRHNVCLRDIVNFLVGLRGGL